MKYPNSWELFQLTRLMRGVTVQNSKIRDLRIISTHTPHARRDSGFDMKPRSIGISTHTPHARRDIFISRKMLCNNISTHTPHARRDCRTEIMKISKLFQLTRLMRGVTDDIKNTRLADAISTHTPHARRDRTEGGLIQDCRISTHTPHARRDLAIFARTSSVPSFQLTRLMRGVTYILSISFLSFFISTHTPHARRDFIALKCVFVGGNFNSHASCEA